MSGYIRIEGLHKTFRNKKEKNEVLKGIDLSIEKGDIFGIVGFSGAGKSTLVRCINRLEEPDSGKVWIGDTEITSLKKKQLNERRKKIGMIFQQFNLFDSKTVFQNIAYPLKLVKTPKKQIEEKVDKLLELVGLSDKKFAYPGSLSGGQKRKLSIACALVLEPEVLLLDEPFAGLDGTGKDNLIQILQEEKKKGTTILFVSHDPNLLCEIADKIIVKKKGKIVRTGTPAEIYTPDNMNLFGIGLPSTRETADLISLDMSENLTYDSFISKLVNKLSSKIS